MKYIINMPKETKLHFDEFKGKFMCGNGYDLIQAIKDSKPLEQEPKEITLDEVKEYCRKRCLTLITNQLFHELTHHQEPILDKIKAKIEQSRYGLVNDGLDLALNIIDECVAEQEKA